MTTATASVDVNAIVAYADPSNSILHRVRLVVQRQVLQAAGGIILAGMRLFVDGIVRAYEGVETAADAAETVEGLLNNAGARRMVVMLDELADAHRQKTRGFEKPSPAPWLDHDLIERLDAFRRLVDAFNQSSRRYPDKIPQSIRWLLEKARTKNFHEAYDDSRIPASIRLAYHAHHGLFFHRIALHQVHMGRLPARLAHPVRDALKIDLRRALGLAIGMPGAEHVRDSLVAFLVDVEPLDIDEEEKRWQAYLQLTES